MSKNRLNKVLASKRVVAYFSGKDKNGTPRYDIYKMKQPMYSNEYQKREYQSSNNVVPVKEVMAQNQ